MRHVSLSSLFFTFFIMLGLTSCDLAGDIFEAGAWTAIIGIVLVIAVIVWLIRKIL